MKLHVTSAMQACIILAIIVGFAIADPSFIAGSSVSALQDSTAQVVSWATNVSDGAGGTTTVQFVIQCANENIYFASAGKPAIGTDGKLTFTPAASITGSSLCSVYLQTPTVGCGLVAACQSPTVYFTITILPVNSCPTWNFNVPTPMTVNENTVGAQTFQFATNLAAGAVSSGTTLKASWESSQTLSISLTTASTNLFLQQPTAVISGTTASVRFEPATGMSGAAIVYAMLFDNGGSAYGGCDHTSTQSFTITITFVNQAPTFATGYSPVVVNQNSGTFSLNGWATKISPGTNEDSQSVQFSVTYATSSDSQYFSIAPAISSTGALTFTPKTNWCTTSNAKFYVVLTDSLGLASCDLTKTQAGTATGTAICPSFQVQVVCVNMNPYFTPGTDITVWEQSADNVRQTSSGWARGISAGSSQEDPSQLVSFVITQSNNALYSIFPSIPSGTNVASRDLTFAPAAYQNGQSLVTVQIIDDQSANYQGNSAQLNINVLPVNNAPVFNFVRTSYSVLENVGAVSIDGFINSIAPGPAAATDEVSQKVSVSVTGSPASAFVVPPALFFTATNAARVDFTLADNIYGTVTLTVTAVDDGGTARGGSDTSSQTFTVTILQVNNPPTFVVNPTSITNLQNTWTGPGAVLTNFVTSVTSGLYEPQATTSAPAGVTGSSMVIQNVTLSVTSTRPELFLYAPNITQTGTLMYTLKPDTVGSAVITVTATDTGSPPLSTSVKVPITVLLVNQAPSFSIGSGLSNKTLTECRTTPNCPYTYTGWALPISYGPSIEVGQTVAFTIDVGAAAFLFAVVPTIDATSGTLSFALTPNQNTFSTGELFISITCKDSGGTANGGRDTTVKSANISVAPFSSVPKIGAVTASLQMLRNQAPKSFSNFLSSIDAGYVGKDATSLKYTVTINSGAALFNTVPVVVASSTTAASITVNISAHIDGVASLTVTLLNAAQGKSTSVDFSIIVLPVNEQPEFTMIANLFTVNQGTTGAVIPIASNVSAGVNEPLQSVAFTLLCPSTPVLFSGTPIVDSSGQLRVSTLSNAEGTVVCTLYLTDNGGTANNGIDTSTTASFSIQVTWVNHVPSFVAGTSAISTLENVGTFSLLWATSISPGLYDTSKNQVLSFVTSCDSKATALFSSGPQVDATGTLKFTTATNAFGSTSCTVTLCDNGPGAPSPNVNCTDSVAVSIVVQFVNQPPQFVLSNTTLTVVAQGAGYSYPGFATGIAPGPTNENSQTLQVSTTVTVGASLFSVSPTTSLTGTLAFTTAVGASGLASVSICFADNGGTQNGGADVTCAVLTISVVKLAIAPTYNILNTTVLQLQRSGYVRINSFISSIAVQSGLLYGSVTMTQAAGSSCDKAFATVPSIDYTAGYLQFAALDSFFGVCSYTVNVTDAQNGKWSATTVVIRVLQVNVAPSFTPGAINITTPYTASATAFAWASQIVPGDAAEIGLQNVTGYATVLTSGVFVLDRASFDAATGYLNFAIASDVPATGQIQVYLRDTGGTANGGSDTSSSVIVTIVVLPTNTAPTFMLMQRYWVNQSNLGNSITGFAYLIMMGTFAWEQSQLGTFTVSANDTSAFSALPAMTSAGMLSFTLVSTFVGDVNLTVTLTDNGGTAHGGVNSLTRTTLLSVAGVNAAPAFTFAQTVVYAIQGVPLVVSPWALSKSAGNSFEDSFQKVTYSAALAASAGQAQSSVLAELSITPDNMTITTQRFVTGSIPITVTAVDNGGTVNGGVDTFSSTFTVVTLLRNAPPVFTVSSTITVVATPAKISLSQVVTGVSAVESGQTVSTSVRAADVGYFTSLPALDAAGGLSFTLVDDNSTRTIQLIFTAVDNGGTSNGGNDTTTQVVTLQVNRPRVSPTFALSTTSLTVSTASRISISSFVSSIVSNGDSSVVTFNVSVSDPSVFSTAPAIDSLGTLTAVLGTSAGAASLFIVGYNVNGVASSTVTVSVLVVLPTTIQVVMNVDVNSFDQAAFRQQIATIFAVSVSSVIIVSVSAGSVIVNFYIAGVQSSLSASTFVTRANTASDPLRTALSISSANIASVGSVPTTPQPSTAAPPSAASSSSSDVLGISTTFWIVGAVVVFVIIVAIVTICCCWVRSRAKGKPEEEPEPEIPTKTQIPPKPKVDDHVWIDVDDDQYLPRKVVPPQNAVFTRQDPTPAAAAADVKHRDHRSRAKYSVRQDADADVFVDVLDVDPVVEPPPPSAAKRARHSHTSRASPVAHHHEHSRQFTSIAPADRSGRTPARNGPSWINRYNASPSTQF